MKIWQFLGMRWNPNYWEGLASREKNSPLSELKKFQMSLELLNARLVVAVIRIGPASLS